MSLEHGVKRFIRAAYSVEVLFPVDWNDREYIQCDKCRFFSPTRNWCNLANDVVEFPRKYVGSCCPLEREEGEAWESQS